MIEGKYTYLHFPAFHLLGFVNHKPTDMSVVNEEQKSNIQETNVIKLAITFAYNH